MRLRLIYSLLAIAALLALVVGVGSTLLSPAAPAQGGISAAPTRTSSPTTRPDPPMPTPSISLVQPTIPPVPDQAAPSPPTESSTPPAQAPPQDTQPPIPAEPSATPAPLPTRPPAADRVGGPVTVPNDHPGRRWVTLQAGHWRTEAMPLELQHLATHTGAFAAGISEVDINVAVSQKTAQLLADCGFNVEILDSTIPISYTTDLFVAIHADGNASTAMRGFKAVAPWVSVPASDQFVGILYEEYGKATGLPADPVTSISMADYYAFNPLTYNHAIDPRVPAALIEMGFITNPIDRHVLTQEQDRLAWGIANAVDRFFRSGAVGDTPTPYPSFTPSITPTPTMTPTLTSTATATSTPTLSATAVPTELAPLLLPTVFLPATPTPNPPPTTPTPRPTATPLQGITTADGRWLPPLAPNGRSLPQPGTDAPPVKLSEAVDEPVFTPDGRERQQIWQQFYIPQLGRSVWRKGPDLYVRP